MSKRVILLFEFNRFIINLFTNSSKNIHIYEFALINAPIDCIISSVGIGTILRIQANSLR